MTTTQRLIASNLGALVLVSWLSTGCGGDASLGNNQGGLESGNTGGRSNAANGGSQSAGKPSGGSPGTSGASNSGGQGGASSPASGGVTGGSNSEGGALSETGGAASGGTGSGGKAGGASGGQASGGQASGGNASGGNASGGTASGGQASGGQASGGNVNPADSLTDPNTTGSAECATTTLGDLIDSIHQSSPDLADVTAFYRADSTGAASAIYAFKSGNGFRLVFERGSGDCPAGCINREFWYFETDAACAPVEVGNYARVFDATGNCYLLTGAPLWNLPAPNSAAACP